MTARAPIVIKAARSKRPALVRVRSDCALVIMLDGQPCIVVRPVYREGLGPALEMYRVGIGDAVIPLATFKLAVINELVKKLPIAMSAAMRLQAKAVRSK